MVKRYNQAGQPDPNGEYDIRGNYLGPLPVLNQTTNQVNNANTIPASVLAARKDIQNNPNLTEEQKKLAEARYNVERAKASGGTSLSIQREEEIAKQKAQGAALSNELNTPPVISEQDLLNVVPQEQGFEQLKAGAAGVGGAVGGAAFGAAKVGALLGTAVTPGVGTVVGGVGGAIVGAVVGTYTAIGYEKRKDVKQALKVANTANSNFNQTINALNAGIITKEVALQRFKRDRLALYAARENLKRETDTDLNRFLSDGADELSQVEDYINDLETIYTQDFINALVAPDPSKIRFVQSNANSETS